MAVYEFRKFIMRIQRSEHTFHGEPETHIHIVSASIPYTLTHKRHAVYSMPMTVHTRMYLLSSKINVWCLHFLKSFPLPKKHFQQQLWEFSKCSNVTCFLLQGNIFFISRSSGVRLKQAPVWGLVPVFPVSYTHNEACWHYSIG